MSLYSSSLAIPTPKSLGSGISASAVCISVCLTSLTTSTSNSWEKCFLHLAKIMRESVTKSSFSFLLYSRPVTLLKFIDSPIQVYDIFDLTVTFKLIDSSFKIFLPFCSWNVCWLHVLHCLHYLYCFRLDSVTTAFQAASFDLRIINILHPTMVYAASIRAGPDSI
jgi:hypothetical protein